MPYTITLEARRNDVQDVWGVVDVTTVDTPEQAEQAFISMSRNVVVLDDERGYAYDNRVIVTKEG